MLLLLQIRFYPRSSAANYLGLSQIRSQRRDLRFKFFMIS